MPSDFPIAVFKEKFFDNLPYKVMWMNEKGDVIYSNQAFYDSTGYSKKEAKHLTIFDINPTASKESWHAHWLDVEKKKAHSFNAVHQTKDGKYYDVHISAHFFSNNGKSMIAAIVNNITESSFYRNLLSQAEKMTVVGGWNLNLYDGSIFVTQGAMDIMETDHQQDFLPGQVIRFFQEKDEIRSLLSQAIRKGVSFDKVFTFKTNNGTSKFIRSVCQPILKNNKVYKLIGAYQDVSQQIEKEQSLQVFKALIDNAQDLIYLYNREGKLILYSKSVQNYLGFSKEELDSFSIFDLDKSIEPTWWQGHFDEIVREGVLRFEWLIGKKDGTQFQADITGNHFRFNNIDYNCAVIRDISLKKKNEERLINALNELSELKKELELDNEYLKEEIKERVNINNIVCSSEPYREVLQQMTQVAVTDTTVLITGESGTGKELLATAVHENSRRKDRALIKVNCATLPKELIESELFGHKKGAFTGANENKLGKFSLADGGTIFLDEIGELPFELQAKLLRVLQEGEFDQLGANKTTQVDVRIIAATNRNLLQMVKDGLFREDLYYRLNVFPIHNIPLRARKDDIPLLAQFFLEKYAAKAGKSFKRLSKSTINALMKYSFPGNIRELENLIERAVIIENGTTLQPGNWIPTEALSLDRDDFKSFEEMQRDYIIRVLEHTQWRVSGPKGAATILNMKDKTLFARMKKLGIEKQVGLKR